MFSRALHKENAHNDCIWSCDWGRFRQQPQTTEGGFTFHLLTCFKRILGWTLNNWLGIGSNSSWLDAVGSPPPAGDPEELIVTGGIDDVVKIWRYRFFKLWLSNVFAILFIVIIRDGGLSVKHELRDHSLGVVSVTLSLDGSRLASRLVLVLVLVLVPLNTQTKQRTDAVLFKVNPVYFKIILIYSYA